jgi:hypothetical protein
MHRKAPLGIVSSRCHRLHDLAYVLDAVTHPATFCLASVFPGLADHFRSLAKSEEGEQRGGQGSNIANHRENRVHHGGILTLLRICVMRTVGVPGRRRLSRSRYSMAW